MIDLLQNLTTGIMLGGIYALMALAIVVIYKATRIFNLGHGWFMLIGAYVFWMFQVQLGLPLWLCLILLLCTATVLGLVVERLVMRPLIGQPVLTAVMATLAIGYILWGLQTLVWPGPGRRYEEFIPSAAVHIGDIIISQQHLCAFIISAVAMIAFVIFFRKTMFGLAMRATADDHQLAQSMALGVNRVFSISWVTASIMAFIGGVLIASITQVTPTIMDLGLKTFPAVLFGGLESIAGAAVGGAVVGTLEKMGAGYLDPLVGGGMADLIPYLVLLLVLIFMPYGLFGYKKIERV